MGGAKTGWTKNVTYNSFEKDRVANRARVRRRAGTFWQRDVAREIMLVCFTL